MAKLQVFTLDNLKKYDPLIKKYVDDAVGTEAAKSLKTVAIDGNTLKFYRVEEPVGETAPAYEITLPSTDISGLLTKLSNATVGNVVTVAENGEVADGGVALGDLATKEEVESVNTKVQTNTEAIESINDEKTGILAQAKEYADGKDEAIAEAKKAGTDAQATIETVQEDVEALDAKVGTVEDGKTIVELIEEAKIAATYDDTKVKADITANAEAITAEKERAEAAEKANADAITALETTVDGKADKATTLEGYGITDAYTKTETDSAIATAVANADHLKRSIVDTLPEVTDADENTIYMKPVEGGDGEQKYDEYMLVNGAFEKIGTSAVDLTDYATKDEVATAKTEAIDTAKAYADSLETNYDKAGAATTAETNAKTYTDTEIAKTNETVATNTDAITELQDLVGEGTEPITESEIEALFAE